jgi:hypothetical protein
MIAAVKTELLVFSHRTYGRIRWGYVHVNQIDGEQEKLFVFNHPADYGLSVKQVREAMEGCIAKISDRCVEINPYGGLYADFDTDFSPIRSWQPMIPITAWPVDVPG